ncbi:MAG TPA: flagellar export protein FliJ [Planctomycetota bacterium]|nr:flagellar export protein FliJ [Planctomycetota bacterium]
MKRFTFRFRKLQKLREQDEEASMLRLALAQTNLAREQKALEALAGELQDAGTQLLSLVKAGTPAAALSNADTFRRSVAAAADRQKESVDRADRHVADKQQDFRQAHQKAEVIRKLHEKRRTEHRDDCLRDEQKNLDELAGTRGRRTVHSHA